MCVILGVIHSIHSPDDYYETIYGEEVRPTSLELLASRVTMSLGAAEYPHVSGSNCLDTTSPSHGRWWGWRGMLSVRAMADDRAPMSCVPRAERRQS